MKKVQKMALRRTLMALLVLSVAVGVLVSCKKEESFTVGFDAEFPPYGYKDESGEYVGFDLDLAQEVCDRNGWKLTKQPIDWDSKDMELGTGSIDCIWNGFTMDGREQQYTWTSAYVDNSQVVIVKQDSGIETLKDLAGKVMMVQADSSALAAFEGEDASDENKALAESFESLQQVSDYNTAFLNLESGAAQAVCMDIGVAKYELEARNGQFKMLKEHVSSEQYGVGFKKGNTKLRDAVEQTLQEMLADGSFERIAKTWGLEDSICLGVEGSDAVMKAETDTVEEDSFAEKFIYVVKQLADGMGATLLIFVLTLVFSLPLGLFVTFLRMSRFHPLKWIAQVYISILRGTPLMLQLLVVFFGPYYIFGIQTSTEYRFYAVILGYSLNYAAYFAEIFRAGMEAVPVGQHEAAEVLGYSRVQKFTKIVFPQMVKRVLPPVTNEVITLVKDTSLAFALAYTEMFTLAKQVSANMASVMPLFVAGLFYYLFNLIVAYLMGRIEKKLDYFH